MVPNATVTQAEIGRGQVLRITSGGDQLNAKDNVIMRNKMSALLAAALQTNVNRSSAVVSTITTTTSTIASSVGTVVSSTYSQTNRKESEVCDVDSSSNDSQTNTVTNTTPTLVAPMRITLPMMQRAPGPNGLQTTRIVRPILQIPQSMIRGSGAIRQQVLLATTPVAMTGVVTCAPQSNPVPIEENLIPHGNIEPSVSSTTLEQLREFDLVLEQVKERSTVQPSTVQNKIQVVKQPPISVATDLQEVIQNVSVSYMNPTQISQKVSTCSTVVVVTTYCNVQPAASPALSVTSQSSSSPCVTPAPASSGSVGKTVPKTSAKSPKSKTVKTTAHASKTSPIPKPQQKPQEDEQTTQRIFDILAEYAEQLRNSPDLNNKPAPRRRSNPPTNPSSSSKRKKCSSSKKPASSGQCNSVVSELSPGTEDPRTMGSEDSCGIVQLSVQNSPQETTVTEDHQSSQCSTDFSSVRNQQSETSESNNVESQLSTQAGRQFIFTDSHNQSRNVIIADSAVKEAIVSKLSNTAAVIVPANYIVPVVKGGHSQIAVVSGSSKILATVPGNSGSNMLLFQSFVNQNRKPINSQQNIKTVKYSAVQPLQGISTQILSGVNVQSSVVLSPSTETVTLAHPLAFKKVTDKPSTSIDDKTSASSEAIITNATLPMSATSQKCNVILSSGSQTDVNQLPSDSTSTNQESSDTEEKKILPLCSDGTESEDNASNSTFSINFTTKESPTVPVPVFSFKRSSVNEKDKNQTYQIAYLQTKVGDVTESQSNEKGQQNVIRTIIDNSSTEKIVPSSNSNVKYTQIDPSTMDHYSKSTYSQMLY